MKGRSALLLIAVILMGLSVAALADVPAMINYQGKLMQPSGANVPDGTHSMVFAIYGVPTGGAALWSEPNPNVQVKGGLFSVLLGSVVNLPANIFSSPDRWFGVTVDADPEMTPRQKIASVPYAQIAGTVPDGSITASKLAPGAAIPPGIITMWSGSAGAIPQGWALCDGTNGTPDLRDRFVVGAGSGYSVGMTGGTSSNNVAHSHTVNSHSHTIAAEAPGTNSTGSHQHNEQTIANGSSPGGLRCVEQSGVAGHNVTEAAGSHSHTVNSHSHGGATGSASPGTDSQLGVIDNRPPYYALCFIMKVQ